MNSTLTVSKLAGFILLIGPMLMYIQILPINAETQPIISALFIIFLFCNKEIYKTEFYMLFLRSSWLMVPEMFLILQD